LWVKYELFHHTGIVTSITFYLDRKHIILLDIRIPLMYSKKLNYMDTDDKFNEATAQRPEGDRFIKAGLIEIDLSASQHQIKNEDAWQNNDRNAITLFKNDNMRILMIAMHPGAQMKTHTAPGVISVQVLEGGIIFSTESKIVNLRKDQMITLQAGIPHSVSAREESLFLLTMAIKS
jgi:quercetin dioxygenase-like cupin family protein